MYQPEPDPDKGQRQANLLFIFVLGGLIGASLAISVIAFSRCGTSDQRPVTVSTSTTREVTRVVEVPKVVMREVEVTREVEVPVEIRHEIVVTQEVEVPVEVVREVGVIRDVEVPVEVVHEIVVTREVEVPVEVTREVEATRVVVATPTPTATPPPPSTAAELVERVKHGIARVEARSGGSFFGTTSAGSGFIFAVEWTTAFVATNHHVVEGSNSVEVQIGASTYDALVLGWDAERDVAVLSICCSLDFIALPWSDASPSEGTTVIAIGYPDSDAGNLIATIGDVRAPDDLSIERDFVPHSAPLNPGNSGGPLFSMPGGEVVGINTARGSETLAFYAVPYQAIAQEVADWRSQLIVAPVATPTPTVAFDSVEVDGGIYTVHSILDPAPLAPNTSSGRDPGKRFVTIDIGVEAVQDDVWPVYGEFKVQDSEGYVYDATRLSNVDVGPIFDSGKLPAGQRVRGWVTFEVSERASLTAVLIDPIGGSGKNVIAELTRD